MGLSPQNTGEREARLVEAAVALLQATPKKELNITLLNKALFYLDLVTLRDTGDTATHATYLALPQGPVVAKYDKRLVAALATRGLATQETDGMAKPIRLKAELSEFRYLDEAVRKHAAEIGMEIARLTSAQASEFSHDNPAWQVAYEEGLGGGGQPKAINMTLAMQQLSDDDRDPWLDKAPDEELLRVFREAAERP